MSTDGRWSISSQISFSDVQKVPLSKPSQRGGSRHFSIAGRDPFLPLLQYRLRHLNRKPSSRSGPSKSLWWIVAAIGRAFVGYALLTFIKRILAGRLHRRGLWLAACLV